MSFIDDTWLRKAHQAVHALLDVDTATRRDMIQFLFDEGFWDQEKLTWEQAEAKWRANLNPMRGEFWRVSELWAMSVRFNRPHLMLAMADSLGFEQPRPLATEARRIALLEQLQKALDDAESRTTEIRGELARLTAPLPREHLPTVPGTRPKFSLREETAVARVGPL